MEKTKLWKIIRRMPKGALLHAHMDAMVDFDFLFDTILSTPGMHIHCLHPISTAEELEVAPVKFRFLESEKGISFHQRYTTNTHHLTTEIVSEKSIWSSDYVPNTPTLLTKAADSFPDGGRAGFLSWLKKRCTITDVESLEHHHGVDAVWRKFSSVFTILGTAIYYEPILRAFMRRMMQQLLADGVKWIDLRLAFTFRYFKEGKETPETSYDGMFKVFGEEIEKFKASEEGKGFWGARMIWTGLFQHLLIETLLS